MNKHFCIFLQSDSKVFIYRFLSIKIIDSFLHNTMKKNYVFLLFALLLFVSCSPTVTSKLMNDVDLSKYNFVLWPSDIKGDRNLDYAMFELYSILQETRLVVISESQLGYYPLQETLITHCNITQSRSVSIVSIDFKDGASDLPILYLRGSFSLGWSESNNTKVALSGLRNKMLKLFSKE